MPDMTLPNAPRDAGNLIPRNRALHPVPYDPDYKTSVTRSPAPSTGSMC